ncbi:MAG: IS4 family transposase [Chthoniobacterales bacterium]
MDHISELKDVLNEKFHCNKARITCFSQMLLSLFTTRTVNLNKMACAIESKADQKSRYRRLQRFISNFAIDFEVIASFIFNLFFAKDEKYYLVIDRTNWMWGESGTNILTLAIVCKGIAISTYWELLDNKGGYSDTRQRIDLMQKFIAKFGKDCIKGLLADREFIGNDWMKWLKDEGISFFIRLRNNMLTTNARGQTVSVKNLFRDLRAAKERALYGKRILLGQEAYLSGLRLPNGDVLVVATDVTPGLAIKNYASRWEIETLFSCLKGRGFHFEETHLIHTERIKN